MARHKVHGGKKGKKSHGGKKRGRKSHSKKMHIKA